MLFRSTATSFISLPIRGPSILFADEPTGNLDQQSGENIIQLLFDLNRENGTTLVLVTHDMQLASACQRFLQLDFGCLTEQDKISA